MNKGLPFRPTIPNQRKRLKTLTRLGAPAFTGLDCPSCSARTGDYCDGTGTPHQARIDRALRIAYGQEAE